MIENMQATKEMIAEEIRAKYLKQIKNKFANGKKIKTLKVIGVI